MQEFYDQQILTSTTKRGKFHAAVTAYTNKRKKQVLKLREFYSCDPLAVAMAIEPEVVLESQHVYATVELRGDVTRGQLVVDWRGHLSTTPNVELVTKLDVEKMKQLYVAMVT